VKVFIDVTHISTDFAQILRDFSRIFTKSKRFGCACTRAVESEVPSSDSDIRQFRLSDSDSNSDSGPTPTFSCISYLK